MSSEDSKPAVETKEEAPAEAAVTTEAASTATSHNVEIAGDYDDKDNVIKARTLISATLGDLRRSSFITSAATRALDTYGVSTMSLFKGEWVDKKMDGEWMFKKRYIWLDPTDKSFHWSNAEDIKVPHKRVKLTERVTLVEEEDSKEWLSGEPVKGFVIKFVNGDVMHIKLYLRSMQELELNTRCADWIKCIRQMAKPKEFAPEQV